MIIQGNLSVFNSLKLHGKNKEHHLSALRFCKRGHKKTVKALKLGNFNLR